MAGFIIDIYLEFFFRTVVIWFRRLAASDWPVRNAIVAESEFRKPGMGCRVVVIRYRYRNAGEHYDGIHKQPFLFDNYASAYLRRFPGGSEFPIRINPKNPLDSIQAEEPTFTRE